MPEMANHRTFFFFFEFLKGETSEKKIQKKKSPENE